MEILMSNVVHPMRYPVHEDETKGQVHAGVCNVTACDNTGATAWNGATYGFYCDGCAAEINRWSRGVDLCYWIDDNPTFEEMEELRDRVDGRKVYANKDHYNSPYRIDSVYEINSHDEYDKPSKKQLAHESVVHKTAEIHTMTRQLRRKLERENEK
jgi:hypothetical protein